MKQPDSWKKQQRTVKATQIAFEMDQRIAREIRLLAAKDGLTPSDQMRKMVGLSYKPPKRPRLTLSLSTDDYAHLAARYGLDATDSLAIKLQMLKELIQQTKN